MQSQGLQRLERRVLKKAEEKNPGDTQAGLRKIILEASLATNLNLSSGNSSLRAAKEEYLASLVSNRVAYPDARREALKKLPLPRWAGFIADLAINGDFWPLQHDAVKHLGTAIGDPTVKELLEKIATNETWNVNAYNARGIRELAFTCLSKDKIFIYNQAVVHLQKLDGTVSEKDRELKSIIAHLTEILNPENPRKICQEIFTKISPFFYDYNNYLPPFGKW